MKKKLLILLSMIFLFSFGCTEKEPQEETKPVITPMVYYSVTFNSGSDEIVESQSVEKGKTAVEPILKAQMKTTLLGNVKTEYKFVGWYLGDKLYDFKLPVNGDLTIEAKWEKQGEELVHKK